METLQNNRIANKHPLAPPVDESTKKPFDCGRANSKSINLANSFSDHPERIASGYRAEVRTMRGDSHLQLLCWLLKCLSEESGEMVHPDEPSNCTLNQCTVVRQNRHKKRCDLEDTRCIIQFPIFKYAKRAAAFSSSFLSARLSAADDL